MSAGTQRRRHARGDARQEPPLVEREPELAVLSDGLSAAMQGRGGVVIVEAPAGKGKSRLLKTTADHARAAGFNILGAHGNELERDFPFGLAIQLFEPRRLADRPEEWEALLAGPGQMARSLLETGQVDPAESPAAQEYSLIHGLFWVVCNMVSPPPGELQGAPLAMLVDDAQWTDRSSLRFLSYLSERIDALGVLLVVGVRPGESATDPKALRALAGRPSTTRLRLSPLSEEGVAAMVSSKFPTPDPTFITACSRLTAGNPFLLVELLAQVEADQVRPDGETATRLSALAPEAIIDAVVARLGAMPEAAREIAIAVAILGDDALLRHAAKLARLELEDAARGADACAAVNMLHPGEPLSFVHPAIRSAICASLTPLALGDAHRRAAGVLEEDGAAPYVVAAHLVAAPAVANPRAVEALRVAARHSLERGATDSALRLLERALREPPHPSVYPEVLADLAHAEALVGAPQAVERLSEAIELTEDPDRRAKLALVQGKALYTRARYQEAAAVLDTALVQAPDGDTEITRELEALYVCASSLVRPPAADAEGRREGILRRPPEAMSASERLAVAHIAARDSVRGESQSIVRRLADVAWANGELLEVEASDRLGWHLLMAALLFADELTHAVEVADRALGIARERESSVLFATASYGRMWPLYEQGRIVDAAADAQATLDARPDRWQTHFRTAYGAVACCHIQRGELEEAERSLVMLDQAPVRAGLRYPFLLDVRAQLRLAQHRPKEALKDATEAGERVQELLGSVSPGVVAWRSTAAIAHLALGQRSRAEEFAAEELAQAQQIGLPRVIIRDLRVLGLAVGGTTGIDLLREAVEIGSQHPPRLEYIHALVDLGAALRRDKQRAAARGPLRRALELSALGGAAAIAVRAQTELAASGARSRSVMLSGVESLTPSERRVAELGCQGLTRRQMAETLFVSPKTIEYHLRHIYQKLDISSREQLAGVLSEVGAASLSVPNQN